MADNEIPSGAASAPDAAPPADSGPSSPTVEGGAAPSTPETPVSHEAALDATLSAAYDRLNPPRGRDGTFAATEQLAPALSPGHGSESNSTDQPETEAPEQPEADAIDAPQSWSAELKAKWGTLPPDVREFVSRRESEAHGAITRMGHELAQFRPLGEMLASHRDTFERHGANVQSGIAALLNVQRQLDADPAGTIASIAQMYGVDLASIAGSQQQQGPVDPTIAELRRELAGVKQTLTARERAEREAIQRQEIQLQEQTNQEVGKWSAGKPHFEAVRQAMAVLVASGQAKNLDEAYDMAVHAIPAVRQKVLAEKAKADEAKRLAENEKHASEAKRQASLNLNSRRGVTAHKGSATDDAYLEALYDRVQGGG